MAARLQRLDDANLLLGRNPPEHIVGMGHLGHCGHLPLGVTLGQVARIAHPHRSPWPRDSHASADRRDRVGTVARDDLGAHALRVEVRQCLGRIGADLFGEDRDERGDKVTVEAHVRVGQTAGSAREQEHPRPPSGGFGDHGSGIAPPEQELRRSEHPSPARGDNRAPLPHGREWNGVVRDRVGVLHTLAGCAAGSEPRSDRARCRVAVRVPRQRS